MQSFETTIDSSQLVGVGLPDEFRGKQLRIVVYPSIAEEESKNNKDSDMTETEKKVWATIAEKERKGENITARDFVGIFSEYATLEKIAIEDKAWEMAVLEKHGFS